MKQINFENHRKNKISFSHYISVITPDGKIESGWTCGRSLNEINEDFGEKDKDWFYFQHKAAAYIEKNKSKF